MYLINTSSLAIEYAQNSSDVDYGILSHRWEREEVTYQDMRYGTASTKYGYQKVVKACEQARVEGLTHMWVDTCCIDKSSSAELTEAINSMYAWYSDARICYAYLSDVGEVGALKESVWFTRGWTLQELIAPSKVDFYTSDWTKLGSKSGLCAELSHITGIPVPALTGKHRLAHWTIAQRMSWAACRVTTRPEDRAYSLMGIFEINMPLLYGEGRNAFQRLQEEIIKKTDDHSVFAWHAVIDVQVQDCDDDTASSFFAKTPDAFANCSGVNRREPALQTSTYTMTNRGLSIQLPWVRWSYNIRVALLNCVDFEAKAENPCTVGIFIRQLDESDQFARVMVSGQDRVLYESGCFKDHKLEFHPDQRTIRAIFHKLTAQGPMIYKPMPSKQDFFPVMEIRRSNLFIRDDWFTQGQFEKPKFYGFWIRRFSVYRKDSDFNREKDFSIRSLHAWDWEERRVSIPDGCFEDACCIHVRGKKVKVLHDQWKPGAGGLGFERMPSMMLRLGFSNDGEYDIKIGFKYNVPKKQVASVFSDAKSDVEVLADQRGGIGGIMGVTYPGNLRGKNTIIRQSLDDHNFTVTTEMVDGVETNILDLFWQGRGSSCDECGKVLHFRHYCCVSCEPPYYDCCRDCLLGISNTKHDAKPGNELHRFRSVGLKGHPKITTMEGEEEVKSPRLLP